MTEGLSIGIVGAGARGFGFADLIASLPQWGRVTAVAEPRREYRESFVSKFQVPADHVFTDWRPMADGRKLCDAVIIATPDREHVEPALAFTAKGYHMLLEKPMATSLSDCQRISAAQREAGTITCVCHSLRYHSAFAALKRVLQEGRIGRLVTLDQLEQVAWWHQAHSFVRGNWANEGRSSFMLLAKSCHDIDYIAYLAGAECQRVQSMGSLSYFRPERAPRGSAKRCTDCALEPGCAYSAIKAYVDADREKWPAATVSLDHSRQAHLRAVQTGPYGRCVWKCDNDVVDHQVVSLEFEGGITATFTMTAFTQKGGRRIRVHGTEGEAEFTEQQMWVRTFADDRTETVPFDAEEGGHGGGDARVLVSFLAAIRERDPRLVLTDVQESLRTHTIVFAAERSRRQGRLVQMEEMDA